MDYQEDEMKVQEIYNKAPYFLFLYLTDIKLLSSCSKSYWMLSDSECDSG